MIHAAIQDEQGLHADCGPAVIHGKLDSHRQGGLLFGLAYPSLSREPAKATQLSCAALCDLKELLVAIPPETGSQTTPDRLAEILRDLIVALQRRVGQGEDFVVALMCGPDVAVASNRHVDAFLHHNGKLLPRPSEPIPCTEGDSPEVPLGQLVHAHLERPSSLFVIAPSLPGSISEILEDPSPALLQDLKPRRQAATHLAQWLARDNASSCRLVFHFHDDHNSPAERGHQSCHRCSHGVSGGPDQGERATALAAPMSTEQLSAISGKLEDFRERLQVIQDKAVADDRATEGLLQLLRNREEKDFEQHIVEPLLQQLILLYDRTAHINDVETAAAFRGDLLDMLAVYGARTFEPPGHRFDGRWQTCIGHQQTQSASADGMVAKRVRKGFRRGDRILRFEEVLVWRYEPPQHFLIEETEA